MGSLMVMFVIFCYNIQYVKNLKMLANTNRYQLLLIFLYGKWEGTMPIIETNWI